MTMTPLFRTLLIAAALSCGAAASASAQVRSDFAPCGVQIIASDAPSIFAFCGMPGDTTGGITVGGFSAPPPGVLAYEIVIDCYNNPQRSNPPIVRSTGLSVTQKSIGCAADAPFIDNPRISVVSLNPATTFTFR